MAKFIFFVIIICDMDCKLLMRNRYNVGALNWQFIFLNNRNFSFDIKYTGILFMQLMMSLLGMVVLSFIAIIFPVIVKQLNSALFTL